MLVLFQHRPVVLSVAGVVCEEVVEDAQDKADDAHSEEDYPPAINAKWAIPTCTIERKNVMSHVSMSNTRFHTEISHGLRLLHVARQGCMPHLQGLTVTVTFMMTYIELSCERTNLAVLSIVKVVSQCSQHPARLACSNCNYSSLMCKFI